MMMHRRHLPSIFAILLFISSATTPFMQAAASAQQFEVNGKVIELDESNVEAAISTFDYIFIDFYAPWCGHCKRLSPELDKAAPVLAGLKKPIVIAKVNVDKYKRLGPKYDIDGYPTLKIFVHGASTEYYGPRKAELLVQYLKKFVAPDVAVLESDSAVSEFVKEAGTDFPIFIGFGVNESMISNLGVKHKKKAWFSVAKDFSEDLMALYDFDKVPALVALHPRYNEQSVFYGPFEETFLEDYIKQSLLPLVLPINQESLKSLKDDKRKIALTIMKDETDEKSVELIKVLKAAASANRDLVFGYVGFKQFEDFAESFDFDKKTQLPKMVVWDGNEEYFSVIGSDSIEEVDQGSQITRFLEGYRKGSVIQKHISGPSFMGFMNSFVGIGIIYAIFIMAVIAVVVTILAKEEPLKVGTREDADLTRNLTASRSESDNLQQSGDKKED